MATVFDKAGSLWFRALEPLVSNARRNRVTAKALRAARMAVFPEYYQALSYLAGVLGALVLGSAGWLGARASPAFSQVPVTAPLFAAFCAIFGFVFVRLAFLGYPRLRAAGRARRIDMEMPSVVTLCYALARGDVNPLEVIRTVALEKRTYGEAAVEFGVVVKNVEWMGLDLISAIKDASESTPSIKLRAFFDGFVTMLNSGADAKDYFEHAATQEIATAELGLEKDLEQASLLAEVYVSGLLVLPLLLMVVIAGLAPLSGEQTAIMPLIVFAFIPLGTIVYLLLVDTLLPPESLAVPRAETQTVADFGLASVRADAPMLPPAWGDAFPQAGAPASMTDVERQELRSLRRKIANERARMRVKAGWRAFLARMLARPTDALEFSGILGLAVLIGGGIVTYTHGVTGSNLNIAVTGILMTALVVTAIPVALFHEVRVRRAQKVEAALPENLTKLAGFNERGISLLQSFQILGHSATGPLAKEFRALERDVAWNGSLLSGLRRLRQRVNTLRMTKLTILLERASAATGSLREVLGIAARDANQREQLRATRRQSMMSYVVIIYIVFAVFLYVLFMVANLFYGPTGLGSAAASQSGAGLSAGLEAKSAQILFAQAAVIQGIACGMVAGRLGEGYTLSGLKHAAILGAAAYIVFIVGVLS